MKSFISEDNIEQAILQKLEAAPFCYDIVRCDVSPNKREVLPDGTGRDNKKQCVLPKVLRAALTRLNHGIPQEKLEEIARELCRDFSASDLNDTNYKYYNQIRNGIQIKLRRNGKEDFAFVRLVDFDNPENNTFTAVSQMWIQGWVYWQQPDVLIFINGLPMVFIELKNASPGSEVFRKLFDACGPCLILMDELVAYGRKLYGDRDLPAGTFDNFTTFIQEITEGARQSKNSLVVASIPEGFPPDIVRTLTENCNTLNVETFGFEE